MDDDAFLDDPRVQELQLLELIFPDARLDRTSLSGEIRVSLPHRWKVTTGALTTEVDHLPPVTLSFSLPEGYPLDEPPQIAVRCPVLTPDQQHQLCTELHLLWEGYRDQVVFSMVDHLQQEMEAPAKWLANPLPVSAAVYYAVVAHNQAELQREFNHTAFECAICQDPYVGSQGTKFDCGHVFCNGCLSLFFGAMIELGEVDKIHCPDPDCTRVRAQTVAKWALLELWVSADTAPEQIVATILAFPVPLAQLTAIVPDLVNRFVELYHKQQYEFISKLLPNRMVPCAREGCPEVILRRDLADQLVQCPRCHHAFCYTCKKSWHAKFVLCSFVGDSHYGVPTKDIEEYLELPKDSQERKVLNSRYGHRVMAQAVQEWEMDQLFTAMLEQSSDHVQCPACDVYIEKTDGCNKMTCSRCHTKFCFLCGEVTGSTYDHFNTPGSTCYRKLFQGMAGMDNMEDMDPFMVRE